MKLQIAFDLLDLEKSLAVAKEVEQYTDKFEVGAPLLYKYGVQAIEKFRATFPDKTLLAETQIVDHGKDITELCIKAGADWLTVMSGTDKHVIHSVCSIAGKSKKDVMIDLLDTDSLGQAAMDAKNLGVDAVLFHKSHDEAQAFVAIEKWDIVRGNTKLPIFIGSGITKESINRVLPLQPDGIIISKAITEASNPGQEAEFFYNSIKNYKKVDE